MQLSVKETASDIHYRRQPKATREIVTAYHSTGVDQILIRRVCRHFLRTSCVQWMFLAVK